MVVNATWFRATSSPGYLQTVTPDSDTLNVRAWWDVDDDDVLVVFLRLALYPEVYLYIAVSWESKTIISTACAGTDKRARRLVLEDLERRGWEFS